MEKRKVRESLYPAVLAGKSDKKFVFVNDYGVWVNRPENSTMRPTQFNATQRVRMPDGREFPAMVLSTQGTKWAKERWCSYAVALIGEMIVQCLIDKRDLDGRPPFRSNHFVRWQGRGNEFKGMPIVKVLGPISGAARKAVAEIEAHDASVADAGPILKAGAAKSEDPDEEPIAQDIGGVATKFVDGLTEPDRMPTADPELLVLRTAKLLDANLTSTPVGEISPRRIEVVTTVFERLPEVREFVFRLARGKCELCRHPAPFEDTSGYPFLEVHHVKPLAKGGTDRVENAVAVCPNCHRRLHHSKDAVEQCEYLYRVVNRLRRE